MENLNKQVAGSDLEGLSLEDVILTSYNKGDILPAFNNAAQVCMFITGNSNNILIMTFIILIYLL